MHLRLRPLQEPIELLFLLVVQDFADLLVGLIAMGPHLGQSLFARHAFVLHDLLRGVMRALTRTCGYNVSTLSGGKT